MFRRDESPSVRQDKDRLMQLLQQRDSAIKQDLPKTAYVLNEQIRLLKERIATHDYRFEDELFSFTETAPVRKKVRRYSREYEEMWEKTFREWDKIVNEIYGKNK